MAVGLATTALRARWARHANGPWPSTQCWPGHPCTGCGCSVSDKIGQECARLGMQYVFVVHNDEPHPAIDRRKSPLSDKPG